MFTASGTFMMSGYDKKHKSIRKFSFECAALYWKDNYTTPAQTYRYFYTEHKEGGIKVDLNLLKRGQTDLNSMLTHHRPLEGNQTFFSHTARYH